MVRKRSNFYLLLVLSVLAVSIVSCVSSGITDEPLKKRVIVEANLSAEEINRIKIAVGDDIFGAYDLYLEQGTHAYTARLDGKEVTGSLEVSEETELLQLHFPEKKGMLVGVGRQLYLSPQGKQIAYNHGASIKVYDIATLRTHSIDLPGDSYVLEGWVDESTLILTGTTQPGTWAVTSSQLNQISNQTLTWSTNFLVAACNDAKTDQLKHDSHQHTSGSITKVLVPGKYDVAAVSGTGAVAYLEIEQGQEKGSLYIYRTDSGKVVSVAKDSSIVPSSVRFSESGRYLTYFKPGADFSTELVIYDTLKEITIKKIAHAGLWFAWDEGDTRLLYTQDNNIFIYDFTQQEDSQVLQGDLENRVTMVSFLDKSKVAYVEEGQLFVLDYVQEHSQLVDNDVDFVLPIPARQQFLYISDYNFIILTNY